MTVEFVRPHCFGGLFPDDFLRASGDLQKALMEKKAKQQKKSQTQRKAYICHDGLSHCVKAVFFAQASTAVSNTFICRRKNQEENC